MRSPHKAQRTTRTEDEIRKWLITSIARVVKMKPEQVDAAQSFDAFGMNSLQAVSLSGDLEEWMGEELSPTLVWDYPSIDSLVRYLMNCQSRHGGTADGTSRSN